MSVVSVLDTHFHSQADVNQTNIKKLLKTLDEDQSRLEKELATEKDSTRNILSGVLNDAQNQLEQVSALKTDMNETRQNLARYCYQHGITKTSPECDQPGAPNKAALAQRLLKTDDQLNRVTSATSYIKALLVSTTLISDARALIDRDSTGAVQKYIQLSRLVCHLEKQPGLQIYPHLAAHLKVSHMSLWRHLDGVLTTHVKEAIKAIGWPAPLQPPYEPKLQLPIQDFQRTFRNLLLLQEPSAWEEPASVSSSLSNQLVITAPMSLLLESLALRFRFHFEGRRETNRLDKPEWYLGHVIETVATHIPFLLVAVQPVMDEACKSLPGGNQSAKDQFIRGLLENIRRKVRQSIPKLLQRQILLSHTIHELLLFDKKLQDEFSYDATQHGGVASVIIDNPSYFHDWLEAERNFLQTRYYAIASADAFEPYRGEGAEGNNDFERGTTSAVKLQYLMDAATDVYKDLPNVEQRIEFFVKTQIDLLRLYRDRVSSAADKLEARNMIRSMPLPGSLPDNASDTRGTLAALQRLCRWWSSARKMHMVLQNWESEEHFMDLIHAIRERNKTTLVTALADEEDTSDIDMINPQCLSTLVTRFNDLCNRMADMAASLLAKEWATNARTYAKREGFMQSLAETTDASDWSVSNELRVPLKDLRSSLHFLHSELPPIEFQTLYNALSHKLDTWVWNQVLMSNRFSTHGIRQLEFDLQQGLWHMTKEWIRKPENRMRRTKEAMCLLKLPFSTDEEDSTISCQQVAISAARTQPNELDKDNPITRLGIETLSMDDILSVIERRHDVMYSWN